MVKKKKTKLKEMSMVKCLRNSELIKVKHISFLEYFSEPSVF